MSFFRNFIKSEEPAPEAPAPAAPAQPPTPTAAPVVADHDEMKITVEDEPEIDPIRSELESKVRQKDAAISALEKARAEKQQQLSELEAELEQERLTQMTEALVHKIESERIQRQTAHAADRLNALNTDMNDKAAIHEYANLIKGVAPKGGVDDTYVTKLQQQLQKAVGKMEATTQQMQELEQSNADMVDSLSSDIIRLISERCRTELDLRKQMTVLDEQKREMQLEYEDKIRQNLKTLQALRAKAVRQTTIDELEQELQETEDKLEELSRIHEKQATSIEELQKSLASSGGM